MSFDRTGNMLSVGDKGGRLITFQLSQLGKGRSEWNYLTEFQAHNRKVDVLSSQEISEAVTDIEWCNSTKSSQPAMLVANRWCVKLFRVYEKSYKKCESSQKKFAKTN